MFDANRRSVDPPAREPFPRRLGPIISAIAAALVVLAIVAFSFAPDAAGAQAAAARDRIPAAATYPPTPTPIKGQSQDDVAYQINPAHSGMSRASPSKFEGA